MAGKKESVIVCMQRDRVLKRPMQTGKGVKINSHRGRGSENTRNLPVEEANVLENNKVLAHKKSLHEKEGGVDCRDVKN